jgi:hypothetical protein
MLKLRHRDQATDLGRDDGHGEVPAADGSDGRDIDLRDRPSATAAGTARPDAVKDDRSRDHVASGGQVVERTVYAAPSSSAAASTAAPPAAVPSASATQTSPPGASAGTSPVAEDRADDWARDTAPVVEPQRETSEVMAPRRETTEVVERKRAPVPWGLWQLLALPVGIGLLMLGSMALARSGFDVNHIYSPHVQVGGLHHTPLLGLIEVVFGVVTIVAAAIPGMLRSVLALLGLIALGAGIVVLIWTGSALHDRFGVHDFNGWVYVASGALLLLAALLPATRERRVRRSRRLR